MLIYNEENKNNTPNALEETTKRKSDLSHWLT